MLSERIKKIIILAAIPITSLAFLPFIQAPFSVSVADISAYLTSLTGLAGTVLLLWDYALGTRTVTGLFMRDIPWTIRIHTYLGIYGTLLIFLHPLTSILASGSSLLYMFWPDLSTGFEQTISWGRLGLIIMLIVWVTSALIRGRIAYRPWKYLHYASYAVLPATFLHSPSIGSTLLTSKPALWLWYGLLAIYAIITVLRLRFFFGFGKQAFLISGSAALTGNVHQVALHPLQKPLRITNGQYVYLQFGLLGEEHPFSAWDFNEGGDIVITFKITGKFTKRLAAAATGTVLHADGPYGEFTRDLLQGESEPTVVISGGIGLTPFYKTLTERPDRVAYHFECIHNAASSILLPEAHGPVTVRVLSREKAQGPGTEPGHISAGILKKYLREPQAYRYYVCGPEGMMSHAVGVLRSLGVPNSRIQTEKFSL